MLECALIVSSIQKSTDFLTETLALALPSCKITTSASCGEARRLLLMRSFDLVIINAPLHDEGGEGLSTDIAASGICQVMLIVKSEHFDAMSSICEDEGVMVISKPINKSIFWAALKLLIAAQTKLKRALEENNRLKQRIEDIRIIDRAKCMLISSLNMSEQDAHRYIEKQAMNKREQKRAIAEQILDFYEGAQGSAQNNHAGEDKYD